MCSDKCVEEGRLQRFKTTVEIQRVVCGQVATEKYPRATIIELALFRNFIAARFVTES